MKVRFFIYLLVTTVVVILSGLLIANIPASLANRFLPGGDQNNIKLTSSEGSLWQGKAKVYRKQQHFGQLVWEMDVFSLLFGATEIDFWLTPSADSQQKLEIEGHISAENNLLSLTNVKAHLHNASFSMKAIDLQIEGVINLEGQAQWRLPESGKVVWHTPVAADALLEWSGGDIGLALGRWPISKNFQALSGQLTNTENALHLKIFKTANRLPILSLELQATGILETKTHYGLFELLGLTATSAENLANIATTSSWNLIEFLDGEG